MGRTGLVLGWFTDIVMVPLIWCSRFTIFGLKSDANSIRILKALNTERYGQNPSPSSSERLRLNPFGSSLNEFILCGNITLIPRPLPPARRPR